MLGSLSFESIESECSSLGGQLSATTFTGKRQNLIGDLKTLSELLGHESVKTSEIYAKVVPASLVNHVKSEK
jgi:hypothetical protein